MNLEIRSLGEEHLGRAAEIAALRYSQLRERTAFLPERYGDPSFVSGLLRGILGSGLGAVAIEDGEITGFLGALLLPSILGRPSAYSPEWANAIRGSADGQQVTEALYAFLAPSWRARGCHSHWISLLADEGSGLGWWNWLGFGMVSVDAVRELGPRPDRLAVAGVRSARPEDLAAVLRLDQGLYRHILGSPIFIHDDARPTAEDYRAWLSGDEVSVWIAERDEQAAAYLTIGPASEEACTIIHDEGTASILAAYTDKDQRGEGMATALLDRALSWARSRGYVRCAVDFEPMNPLARRFWTRTFTPVVFTVVRHVDVLEAGRHGS
jgi:GNAT superfamily N-acetyltransferase